MKVRVSHAHNATTFTDRAAAEAVAAVGAAKGRNCEVAEYRGEFWVRVHRERGAPGALVVS